LVSALDRLFVGRSFKGEAYKPINA